MHNVVLLAVDVSLSCRAFLLSVDVVRATLWRLRIYFIMVGAISILLASLADLSSAYFFSCWCSLLGWSD